MRSIRPVCSPYRFSAVSFGALTARGVDGVTQFGVLPLAEVILLDTSCDLVGLDLDSPEVE